MTRFKLLACCALVALAAVATQAQAATVTVGKSTPPWNGYMNVSNLPAPDGDGAFQFGSPWGVPDLATSFDDPNSKLTLLPNSIADPNEYWYQNTTGTAPDPANPGGPGQAGNKIMEANLYKEVNDDSLAGQTVTFVGNVISNTFTQAHVAQIFIRDFAPDFSSSVDAFIPLVPGPFSFSLVTDPGLGRHIQYGFQVKGVNVWSTDIAPFGNAMISTIPEPASLSLVGLCSLALIGIRRRSR